MVFLSIAALSDDSPSASIHLSFGFTTFLPLASFSIYGQVEEVSRSCTRLSPAVMPTSMTPRPFFSFHSGTLLSLSFSRVRVLLYSLYSHLRWGAADPIR